MISPPFKNTPHHCLVHYGEISLKGKNRFIFEDQIISNLRRVLCSLGLKKISKPRGRFILEFEENPSWEEIIPAIQRVFGIANFSPVFLSRLSLDDLQEKMTEILKETTFKTFGVRAKRTHKKFEKNSKEIEVIVGRHIEKITHAKVDLSHPECWINIEVGEEALYFSFQKMQGAGGLPLPLSGQAVSLLSGGIDSPVAAYQLMRRGCQIHFIHFHSVPFTTEASIEKVRKIVKQLTLWQMESKLYLVPFASLQKQIVASAPAAYRVLLYRRSMLRLAEKIAEKEGALALVTGENLGQVASQTLPNLAAIERVTPLPLLRPLIGMDKHQIIKIAEKIGTYAISILPDQDCCSFMLPEAPATRARLQELELAEQKFPLGEALENCLKEIKIESFCISTNNSEALSGRK